MKNNRTFLEKLLDGAEVEWKPLNKIVTTITAPVKLKREMYCSTGSTPIIDQGEKFIAGYTDENFEAIPSNEYIIFGDHSEHIKYVNFSFIQGADGLKILKPKEDNAKYILRIPEFLCKRVELQKTLVKCKRNINPSTASNCPNRNRPNFGRIDSVYQRAYQRAYTTPEAV